jgi:hypothetical protein
MRGSEARGFEPTSGVAAGQEPLAELFRLAV